VDPFGITIQLSSGKEGRGDSPWQIASAFPTTRINIVIPNPPTGGRGISCFDLLLITNSHITCLILDLQSNK
jgi:hypothetical protein